MTIALETILEPAVLRRVWKDVRKRERGIHLTQIPLVRDSTGGIAFELSLSPNPPKDRNGRREDSGRG